MSKRYYKIHPRNFANEYTVYVTESDTDAAFVARFPEAERITRAEAIEYGIRKPNWAKRNSQQWFGGLFATEDSEFQMDRDLRGEGITDADRIHYSAIATGYLLAGND